MGEARDELLRSMEEAERETEQPKRDALLLPPWDTVRSADPPKRNPVLIDGVLRLGHVGLLAGKGKVGKSWAAIGLAVATVTGGSWFGFQIEHAGRVLYIDPELDPKSLDNRFSTVCREQCRSGRPEDADSLMRAVDDGVCKWPLRGVMTAGGNAPTIGDLEHDLRASCSFGEFALIIIDSASCFLEGDENAAGDVRRFFGTVNAITRDTGAAVLVVHHFGKAQAGDRSAADRARGSSVWLDAPDAVLTLTEVFPPSGEPSDYLDAGAYAVALESGGIREFPRMEPCNAIFEYPLHRLDEDGVTAGWKPKGGQSSGGKQTAKLNKARREARLSGIAASAIGYFYENRIGAEGLLIKNVADAMGTDTRTLEDALEGNEHLEVFKLSDRKRYVRPKQTPQPEPVRLPLDGD